MKESTILLAIGALCLLGASAMISVRFTDHLEYLENPPINVFVAPKTASDKKIEAVNSFMNIAGLTWSLIGVGFCLAARSRRRLEVGKITSRVLEQHLSSHSL